MIVPLGKIKRRYPALLETLDEEMIVSSIIIMYTKRIGIGPEHEDDPGLQPLSPDSTASISSLDKLIIKALLI